MENHPIFMDHYCEDDNTNQTDLHIQCNPCIILVDFSIQIDKVILKSCGINIEKEEQGRMIHIP
jgi:hypothetical protein